MTEQTIQSQDVKVFQIFQSFYTVPDYQREYVWETEQVEQLLNDINAEFSSGDPKPEYFIGSIVVCSGDDEVFELIDGQQRMTTLFLTLCAIRDRIEELGEGVPNSIKSQIADTSTDANGVEHFRYRLDLQYEDSGDILEQIAKGNEEAVNEVRTRSITNIRNAHDVVRNFLNQEFGEDEEAVRKFYGYLINKVKLIRIQTKDVAKALKIFETINDRGIGLDSMDLLKNLLFMQASREDFENLKNHWKALQDVIHEMGEKPLRFLRYFVFSRYDADVLREDDIYSWFARNQGQCDYVRNPLGFAQELFQAAQAYRNFLSGHDQEAAKNRYLENLRLLGGKAARQHLILLLAGRHLSSELFDKLAREVEDLFFAYVITRESTRDFERNFAQWATDLQNINEGAALDSFIEERFVVAKKKLASRFSQAFESLHYGSVQKYRLRYILAKLTQHIDINAYGETEGTKWLNRYMDGGFAIEHIFPENPRNSAREEFGYFEDENIANRLGNLVLVEPSINSSLGNRPYSEKREVYPKSQLLLTKTLAGRPQVGNRTAIDVAVQNISPFTEWNEASVNARQEQLTTLAREVWRIP